MIDGEGSIQINAITSNTRPTWGSVVTISSSVAGFLDRLREEAGGVGTIRTYKARSPRHRQPTVWAFHGSSIVWLLHQVKRHLRLKREHADVMLGFRALTQQGQRLGEQQIAERTVLALRLREMNAKSRKAGLPKGNLAA